MNNASLFANGIYGPGHGSWEGHGHVSEVERRAGWNCARIIEHLVKVGASCLKDAVGCLCIVVAGERIPLNWDSRNLALAGLLYQTVGMGTLTMESKLTIQRLQVWARGQAASVHFRTFSAVHEDCLYLPLSNSRLLLLSASGLKEVDNGVNAGRFWLEHPYADPLRAFDLAEPFDPKEGLALFGDLLVSTQPCSEPERWLVAMHEGLLPYLRDTLVARFLLVHLGHTQSGKTSGAQRFLLLHGLGQVKGDYSLAAIGDTGDIGLLVLDNKEQADFDRPLLNFLLFAATGAERGRSNPEGTLRTQSARPIVVVTSIEGVAKHELWNRCLSIPYSLPPGAEFDREENEAQIIRHRHKITRSLLLVLQQYLSMRNQGLTASSPFPQFTNHFKMLCGLLHAYGSVAHKAEGWAANITSQWAVILRARMGRTDNEDPLERHILRAVFENRLGARPRGLVWEGTSGVLVTTRAGNLLTALEDLGVKGLPDTGAALARRLMSVSFREFTVLNQQRAPAIPELRRTTESRALGIFVADKVLADIAPGIGHEALMNQPLTAIEGSLLACHTYLEKSDECYSLWEYKPALPNDPITQLIRDFKSAPSSRSRVKAAAMHQCAAALSGAIPHSWRTEATFVPMPPSTALRHPGYDGRVLDLLGWVPGLEDVREMIHAQSDTAPLEKGLSPGERAANLVVQSGVGRPRRIVVLVDDVITSGAHFKAAALVLRREYSPEKIIGLFLARTARN